jgi:hypothetical protein
LHIISMITKTTTNSNIIFHFHDSHLLQMEIFLHFHQFFVCDFSA